jgi:hypothetical protein
LYRGGTPGNTAQGRAFSYRSSADRKRTDDGRSFRDPAGMIPEWLLFLDPFSWIHDELGRPIPILPEGKPIPELIA